MEREQLKKALADLRIAQAQLLHVQKLTAIGQLAAGIAHEINTPMQLIGDNVGFLKTAFDNLLGAERQGDDERAYLRSEIPSAIEQTLDGIERVTTIVRAMKDFSHPSGGRKVPADVHACLDSTFTVARNVWKYVADLEKDDLTCPSLPILRDEFNQVILNLVVNAADAISEVTAGGAKGKGVIRVQTRRLEESVEIRAQDTGGGIPEAVRPKIFEPYFTTKAVGKGTGQGLAIAHSVIVDKHGGQIGFDSTPGRGTTFWIRLPIACVV